jgi:hypothetical protein
MRMQRNGARLLAVVGVLTVSLAAPAWAVDGVIEINQASVKAAGKFPFVISQSGSYRLTSNLDVTDATARPSGTAAENTTAIQVMADNVTIDLNGFSILGPNVCTGFPPSQPVTCNHNGSGMGIVSPETTRTTLANGVVSGLGADGVRLGNFARIEKVHVENNGSNGIEILSTLGENTVIGNTAVHNGSDGISNVLGIVNGNVASYNGGVGISANGTVSGNRTTQNFESGIQSSGGAVIGNSATLNKQFGLDLSLGQSGYANNVLTGNNGGDDAPANPQVSGGIQMGTNVCGTDTICP